MAQVTYLISQYPAFNHTFVLREIQALRQAGVTVSTISIRGDDRPLARLTDEERVERDQTWYVKVRGAGGFLLAFARQAARSPGRLVRSALMAGRLGGWDVRALVAHLFYWAEAMIVADHLARTSAQHLHVHFASTVGLLAHLASGCPFSVTIHGPAEFETPHFGMRAKVQHASLIVTISQFGRSQVLRQVRLEDWPKVRVVRLGVDTARYALRARRPAPPRSGILTVGRLAPVKGQAVLLEAMKLLVESGVDAALTLVGSGPEHDRLEAIAVRLGLEDRVTFTGALNQIETREQFAQADLFALTSFAEGIPVVLMEAMALGVPCVASRVNGVPELIEHGVTGLLVSAGDAEGAATCMARLLADEAGTTAMVIAAREYVARHFDLLTNARLLVDELMPYLERRGASDGAARP